MEEKFASWAAGKVKVPQPEIVRDDDPLEPEEAREYEGCQEDEDDHHHGCERTDCGQLRNMMNADLRWSGYLELQLL